MNDNEIKRIAAQLQELRDINDIHGPQGAELRKALERLAREDLYLANRLFENHVSPELRAEPGVKPQALQVAPLIERHFEGRVADDRPAVQIHGQPDAMVLRPESGKEYDGRIIGHTPDFAVQKVDNDYVLHRHASLSIDPAKLGDDVKIRYPFAGSHSIGLVEQRDQGYQQNQQMLKAPLE
ncbi:MAG: hypothetical protein AB7E12_16170, partial [Burkholderiaceae bacterium]